MTAREALAQTQQALLPAAGEAAAFEARQLLAHVLGVERLPPFLEGAFSPEQAGRLAALVEGRLSGEPLQYLLGEWAFMGLPFYVGPEALIPRQDTETLCEAVLERRPQGAGLALLDLCCGTGCIGISLAKLSGFRPTLADISPACLALSARNARRNGVTARLAQGDLFNALGPGERFDVICANPPYIPSGSLGGLQAEVRREPALALDGGPDGLGFYRRIAEGYRARLAPGGLLALEIGADQGAAALAIFGGGRLQKDLCGLDRVLLLEN